MRNVLGYQLVIFSMFKKIASMATLSSWRLLNGKVDAKTMKVRLWSTRAKGKI